MKIVIHNNKWYWGHSKHIVIDNGNGIISIQYDDNYPNIAYLCCLIVVENKRKQGLATKLMNIVTKLALENNCNKLKLLVEKDVEWLVNWYKKLGFVIDESYEDNEHYFQMIKNL